MKYRANLFELLKPLPYYEKRAILQLSEQYGLKSTTVDAYITQTLRRREIIALRRGLYISAEFYNRNKSDISYRFYLANVLRRPSYVSSWTALQYYNLTTEVIHATTSVTTKTTRDFKTRVGDFAFQSIQPNLFSGFSSEKGGFEYFIASPAKALFDLLYFRTRHFHAVRLRDMGRLVEELRIDIDEMAEQERDAFYSLVKGYMRHE
jgi:hypothetical protein